MNEDFDSLLESVGIGVAREEPSSAADSNNRSQEFVTFHMPNGDLEIPIEAEETVGQENTVAESESISFANEESQPEGSSTSTSTLSEDDLADILTDNGYDPFEENNDENQDIDNVDSEDNEEYQEAVDSGGTVSVELNPALEANADVPIPVGEGIMTQIRAAESEYLTTRDLENALAVMFTDDEVRATIAQETPSTQEEAADILAPPRTRRARRMVEESIQEEAHSTVIPPNSPTLTIDNATARFSGAEWFNEIQKARIIVGGCGGISSNAIFQLARMAPAAMYIYDDDTVETVNMAGQLFSRNDVGKYKVDAIENMVHRYTSMTHVHAIRQKFTRNTEPGDIMICGFDNMLARRDFFNAWQRHVWGKPMEERNKCLYLDGRLSLTEFQVLCIQGDDDFNMSRYRDEFLFTSEEAEHTVCSMKQTTYLACMIGSIMVNLFTNFIANTINPIIPYDLPFFTEYDAPNMIFRTEN